MTNGQLAVMVAWCAVGIACTSLIAWIVVLWRVEVMENRIADRTRELMKYKRSTYQQPGRSDRDES